VQSRFNLSGDVLFTISVLSITPEHPTSPLIQGLYISELIEHFLNLLGESDPSFLLVGDISLSYLISVMYDCISVGFSSGWFPYLKTFV